MKKFLYIIALSAPACNMNDSPSDAFGNFEATEITVSALATGQLLWFNLQEGARLKQGEEVGLVDTAMLHLKKKSLQASRKAVLARKPGVSSQAEVLMEQKKNAESELARFQKLAEEGAATEKQVDDLENHIQVLERQIASVLTQNDPIAGELESIEAQLAQIERQIEDSKITAPIDGVALVKLAEPGEWVATGAPLFRLARLDTMTLRAYISGAQLDDVRIGQQVTILVDQDKNDAHRLNGEIVWISDEAEFTPKMIQTKDERVDLVYAVKIRTPNPNGLIKIGMPGEAVFTSSAE